MLGTSTINIVIIIIAASYDPAYSVHTANAKRPSHHLGQEGHQDYLCSAFAPLYETKLYRNLSSQYSFRGQLS